MQTIHTVNDLYEAKASDSFPNKNTDRIDYPSLSYRLT